jgi:hypothetical protein
LAGSRDLVPIRGRAVLEQILGEALAASRQARELAERRAVWLGCLARASVTTSLGLSLSTLPLFVVSPRTHPESAFLLLALLGAMAAVAALTAGVGMVTLTAERRARRRMRAAIASLSLHEARSLARSLSRESGEEEREALRVVLLALDGESGEVLPAPAPLCSQREVSPTRESRP